MSKQRLIDANALFAVVKGHHDLYKGATNPADKARRDECLQVMCNINDAPTIDAITVAWIEDQITQHTSDAGWTDWWGDMCRRFLQEYERRRDDEKAD